MTDHPKADRSSPEGILQSRPEGALPWQLARLHEAVTEEQHIGPPGGQFGPADPHRIDLDEGRPEFVERFRLIHERRAWRREGQELPGDLTAAHLAQIGTEA